jgi:hypothetical protein
MLSLRSKTLSVLVAILLAAIAIAPTSALAYNMTRPPCCIR